MTQRNWTCAETEVTYCAQCIEPGPHTHSSAPFDYECACCAAVIEDIANETFWDRVREYEVDRWN